MIVTANENYINVIMNLSAEDPFACRIISQYNSYDSSLAFVDYWTIIDDKTDECTGDRKSTRLNSSHRHTSRMPSSA